MEINTVKAIRKISQMVLFLCLGILLIAGTFLTYRAIKYKPYKVRVSNVTDSAFTVTWITDEPMVGVVYYSEKNNFLPGPLSWIGKTRAVDDRDYSNAQLDCVKKFNEKVSKTKDVNFTVSLDEYDCNDVRVIEKGQYYTHHVTVQNLDAEKEYFFRVGDGYISYAEGKKDGVEYIDGEMQEIEIFAQKTLPVIKDVSSPNPAYGTSYNFYYGDNGLLQDKKNFDSIIFLKTLKGEDKYPLMSAVGNSDGGWSIDLSNVRDTDGKVVSMDDKSIEFIPQVENGKPGYSGARPYKEIKFPIKLLGNDKSAWGEDKSKSVELSHLLNKLINRTIAYDDYDDAVQCWRLGTCEYRVFTSVCPSGYTSVKSQCSTKPSQPIVKKMCCIKGTSSCSCSEMEQCPSNYTDKYSSKKACEDSIVKTPEKLVSCCAQSGESNCICITGRQPGSCGGQYPKEYNTNNLNDAVSQCKGSIPKLASNCCTYSSSTNSCGVCNQVCRGVNITLAECNNKVQAGIKNCLYDGKDDGVGIDREGPIEVADGSCIYRYYNASNKVSCKTSVLSKEKCLKEQGAKQEEEEACYHVSDCSKGEPQNCEVDTAQNRLAYTTDLAKCTSDLAKKAPNSFVLAPTEVPGSSGYVYMSSQSYAEWLKWCEKNPNGVYKKELTVINVNSLGLTPQTQTNVKCPKVTLSDPSLLQEESAGEKRTLSVAGSALFGCSAGIGVGMPGGPIGMTAGCVVGAISYGIWQPLTEGITLGLGIEPNLSHMCKSTKNGIVSYNIQPKESKCDGEILENPKPASVGLKYCFDPAKQNFSTHAFYGEYQCPSGNFEVFNKSNTVEGYNCCKDSYMGKDYSVKQNCSHKVAWSYCIDLEPSEIILEESVTGDIGIRENLLLGLDSYSKSLISQSYAAEEENTTGVLFDSVKGGIYKVSIVGGVESILNLAENQVPTFFIERNAIAGYQSPENIYSPLQNEDLLVDASSIVIEVSQETTTKEMKLKKGINIISFDFSPSLGEGISTTSSMFLALANQSGDNVSNISYFSGGQWNGGTSYDFEKKETKGASFDLGFGKGYVVVAEQDCTISIPGYNIESAVPIAFSSGWNLVGVHGYSTAYTSKTFIESINTIEGLKANNVTWWPTSRGMYQGYQLQNGQEYGQDFPISPLNGYFVRISEYTKDECKSIWWNPSGEYNGFCEK